MKIFCLSIFLLLCLVSCYKFNQTETGYELLKHNGVGILVKDTIVEVNAQTYFEQDNSVYDMLYIEQKGAQLFTAIGRYEDEDFGKRKASLFFSVERKNSNTSSPFLGKYIIVDSAKLFLNIENYLGDTNGNIKFNVYQPIDTLVSYHNKLYKFSEEIEYSKDLIASYSGSINDIKKDEANPGHLKIKLDKSFGEKLYKADGSVWSSASAFNKYFKGFAIIPDEGSSNTVINVNISDSRNYFVVYYRSILDNETNLTDKQAIFNVTPNCGIANNIKWDSVGAKINFYTKSTTQTEDFAFIQPNVGLTNIKINVPELLNFPPNAAILNSYLYLTEVSSGLANSTISSPKNLFLSNYDSSRKVYTPLKKDYSPYLKYYEQRYKLGGIRIDTLDFYRNKIGVYRFNISSFVQNVINKNIDIYPLIVSCGNFSPFSDKPIVYNQVMNGYAKLYGGKTKNTTTNDRMHIKITYFLTN